MNAFESRISGKLSPQENLPPPGAPKPQPDDAAEHIFFLFCFLGENKRAGCLVVWGVGVCVRHGMHVAFSSRGHFGNREYCRLFSIKEFLAEFSRQQNYVVFKPYEKIINAASIDRR